MTSEHTVDAMVSELEGFGLNQEDATYFVRHFVAFFTKDPEDIAICLGLRGDNGSDPLPADFFN